MNKVILLVTILLLSACAGKFDAKKLDLRKDCTGNETNKTLSDMFCFLDSCKYLINSFFRDLISLISRVASNSSGISNSI